MNNQQEMNRPSKFLPSDKTEKYKREMNDVFDYRNLEIVGTEISFNSVNNRKSSAEIVNEAKSVLNGEGVRLVSTRRPVTPMDPRRQLYGGKMAPPGRPPSSFSLRYLQFESGKPLPPLEPIYQQSSPPSEQNEITEKNNSMHFRRSGSLGTLLEKEDGCLIFSNNSNFRGNKKSSPSLLAPLQLSNEISSRDSQNDSEISLNSFNENQQTVKQINNLFMRRQTKSFDMPLKPSERIVLGEERNMTEGNNEVDYFKTDVRDLECNNILINSSSSKARLQVKSNLLSQSTSDTLLELLKGHAGIKDCNDETVQHINAILIELYTRVKGAVKGDWRSAILGGLYGLVECSSPKILLAVARVVLALSVTGSNLTGACKLVFKVARNESYDYLFLESDVPELLIDGLGRASPLDDAEACIYGYGAVRFLFNASSNMSQEEKKRINNNSFRPNVNNNQTFSCQIINKKSKNSLALRLSRAGAIQLMVLHLQILNEAGADRSLIGQPLHALYQLSAALRAMAGIPQIVFESGIQHENSLNDSNFDEKSNNSFEFMNENEYNMIYEANFERSDTTKREKNLSSKMRKENKGLENINLELACPHLVKAAEISLGESEIQANIVRTLSVLSDHDVCCKVLADYVGRIGMLLGPCYANQGNNFIPEQPLGFLSRLGYILGNIMAKFDTARLQFYHNDVAMEFLLNTLDIYSKQKLTLENDSEDTVVEALIKMIRVIANMSVNADVGYGIGSKPLLGQILLRMLAKINEIPPEELIDDIEELLQAIMGALHNLCFYQDRIFEGKNENEVIPKIEMEENNLDVTCMNKLIPEISIALCDTLKTGSTRIKAEVSRVLGNMTRNTIARKAFCTAGGLKVIVQYLKSETYELKSTCSGVLVNLLGDWERRVSFYEINGPLILYDILEKSTKQSDWLLAGIVCQAFWNYLIDSCDIVNALGEIETNKISAQLVTYLDEEKIFRGEQPDLIWEQFACVATDLLERIQSSLEQGNE